MRFKRLGGYALMAILIFLTGVAWLNRRDQIVGFNQEIQYDDFSFSVQDVSKRSELGVDANRRAAAGVYYVVTLQVANHAKRVPFAFDPKIAVLVDDVGRDHHVAATGQAALESEPGSSERCPQSLPAGDSCLYDLVFELPADTKAAHLRIAWGGRFVDIVDLIFCGDKRIALETQPDSQHGSQN